MVGFIPTVLLFEELLQDFFADEVNGIDCVLETETKAITYRIVSGEAILIGEGDQHDPAYDRFRQYASLTPAELFTNSSSKYTLSLYPTDEMYSVYRTDNPTIALVVALCAIFVTALMFFLYDHFVGREFDAKKELLHAKRQFMRFVSHEVRTPLNSVCMGLAVVQSELALVLGYDSAAAVEIRLDEHNGALLPPEGMDSVPKELELFQLTGEIQTNAQGAVDVLNDLLNYDKIVQGELLLETSTVSVWHLIEQVRDEFKLPAAKKDLKYECYFGVTQKDEEQAQDCLLSSKALPPQAQDLKLIGDSIRITQVFRNLMSNAIKFTPDKGHLLVNATWMHEAQAPDDEEPELVSIQITNERSIEAENMGSLVVSVEDSGAGMSKEQLNKLFSEGLQFNVNELQAGQGSGLGLYIAKGIVEQHGGTLVASSEGLGQGTTFTLTLPIWRVVEAVNHHVDQEESQTNGAMEVNQLRVLVVDDVTSNRKLLCRLLQNSGHLTDQAENGQIALDMTIQSMKDGNPYDSILVDYEMPVMNGPTAVKGMREAGSDAFIVGITGNILPDDVSHFRACGANSVLPKPLKIHDLDGLWTEYGVVGRTQS